MFRLCTTVPRGLVAVPAAAASKGGGGQKYNPHSKQFYCCRYKQFFRTGNENDLGQFFILLPKMSVGFRVSLHVSFR